VVKESLLESSTSSSEEASADPSTEESTNSSGWFRLGAVAAASALVGGLAAAWFYRKTLTKLRQAENGVSHSEIRIFEDDSVEDD
jgi:hypothetical protein